MTFEQVVKMLKPFHQTLWFCCRSRQKNCFTLIAGKEGR